MTSQLPPGHGQRGRDAPADAGRVSRAGGRKIVYHRVVRQGVDEQAVVRSMRGRFADVEMLSYWSNHLGAIHRAAELAGVEITFGVRPTGFSG